MKNTSKEPYSRPTNRKCVLASVAFIHLPGLLELEPSEWFDVIQELHIRLKALNFPVGVTVLSASSGAIIVAPDGVFSRTTSGTRSAIHHFFNDIFVVPNPLPLRIGVTHGTVEYFPDVRGGTYIGRPINVAARLATASENSGLLYENDYCDFRRGTIDNDPLQPRRDKLIYINGKKHDPKFVCFNARNPPKVPKGYSCFPKIGHVGIQVPAFIVAIDLPRFSRGGPELLSKRFRAFVDAAQTLLVEDFIKEWHYSPGGDGGVFVFPGIYPGPVAWMILSLLSKGLAVETEWAIPEASVISRIGAHYGVVQIYKTAGNDEVPTGHACFIAEQISKDIDGGSIGCTEILRNEGGHYFTPNPPTVPIRPIEVPFMGLIQRYLLVKLIPTRPNVAEFATLPTVQSLPDKHSIAIHLKASSLVSEAKAIYSGLYERKHLTLAGKLAREATNIDPGMSSAWAARARIAASFILRGWTADQAAKKRVAKVQTFVRLARSLFITDEAEADVYFALGVIATTCGDYTDAEKMYRRGLEIVPRDAAAERALAFALLPQGRVPEVFALLQETALSDITSPLPHFDLAVVNTAIKNYPAAWKEVEKAISLDPIASAVLLKAWLSVAWMGKPDEMRKILNLLKVKDRNIDEVVYFEMWCGLLRRKSKDVRTAALRARKAYIKQSYVFSGPTAWFTALANHIAGKKRLADLDWRAAEAEIRKHLLYQPENRHFRVQLATTLAWLGEQDGASREIARVLNSWKDIQINANQARDLAGYYAALGDAQRAVPLIRRALAPDSGPGALTIQLLRLDPKWDKIRAAKEFDDLVRG